MRIPFVKALLLTAVATASGQAGSEKKDLSALKEEALPFIQAVEVHGDGPRVIYVPIIHDGPMNHVSSTDLGDLRGVMGECERIAAHLYEHYGVRNILLEGCGKSVADYYKKTEGTDKKISFAHTKMAVFETWGNILNQRRWDLAYTSKKPTYGPLTVLGSEYDKRIKMALSTSKEKGWFRSRDVFVANQAEFSKLLAEAVDGYNDKRASILEEDPKLKREYRLTVTQRNKDFIANLTAKDGPGIIMCGSGHLHDLAEQMQKAGTSYMVVVPKTLKWPIEKKSEQEVYSDMLKQGCKLKSCTLRFGDGTAAKIKIPID